MSGKNTTAPRLIGAQNRSAVRGLLLSRPGCTRTEIAEWLNLSLMAVSRHVCAIRKEWGADPIPTRRARSITGGGE